MESFKDVMIDKDDLYENQVENDTESFNKHNVSPSFFKMVQNNIMNCVTKIMSILNEENPNYEVLTSMIKDLTNLISNHHIDLNGFFQIQKNFINQMEDLLVEISSEQIKTIISILHLFYSMISTNPAIIQILQEDNFDRKVLELIDIYGSGVISYATPVLIPIMTFFRYEYLQLFDTFLSATNHDFPPFVYDCISEIYVKLAELFCEYFKNRHSDNYYQKIHSFAFSEGLVDNLNEIEIPSITEQFTMFQHNLLSLLSHSQFPNVLKACSILTENLPPDLCKKLTGINSEMESIPRILWVILEKNQGLINEEIIYNHLNFFYWLFYKIRVSTPTLYQCISPSYLLTFLTSPNFKISKCAFKILKLILSDENDRESFITIDFVKTILDAVDKASYAIRTLTISLIPYIISFYNKMGEKEMIKEIVLNTNLVEKLFEFLDCDNVEFLRDTLFALRTIALNSQEGALQIGEHLDEIDELISHSDETVSSYAYSLRPLITSNDF